MGLGPGIDSSRTLPVHLIFAILFILLLGDPHLLERTQGCKNRASNPRSKTAFLRRVKKCCVIMGPRHGTLMINF